MRALAFWRKSTLSSSFTLKKSLSLSPLHHFWTERRYGESCSLGMRPPTTSRGRFSSLQYSMARCTPFSGEILPRKRNLSLRGLGMGWYFSVLTHIGITIALWLYAFSNLWRCHWERQTML